MWESSLYAVFRGEDIGSLTELRLKSFLFSLTSKKVTKYKTKRRYIHERFLFELFFVPHYIIKNRILFILQRLINTLINNIWFAWILAQEVIYIGESQSLRENPLVQAVDHHNLSNTTTIDNWDRSGEELLLLPTALLGYPFWTLQIDIDSSLIQVCLIVVYVAWFLKEQRQTFDWFLKNCKFK